MKEGESDAFLGIDIDIEPPETKASQRSSSMSKANANKQTPSKSRKRPRPSSSTTTTGATTSLTSRRKRPKKPKPPPNPPSSLVTLMQTDASVFSYFQLLQANLDYDVEKWKHEAAKWKHIATTNAAHASNNTTTTRRKKNGSNNAEGRKKRSTHTSKRGNNKIMKPSTIKNGQGGDVDEGIAIPITDDVLFGDMSDDSSCSSSDHSCSSAQKQPSNVQQQCVDTKSPGEVSSSFDIERRSYILEKMIEAKRCLDALGVSLVEIEEIESSDVVSSNIDANKQFKTEEELCMNGTEEGGTLVESHKSRSMLRVDGEVVIANTDNIQSTEKNNTIINSEDSQSTAIIKRKVCHRKSDKKLAAEMMASLKTFIKNSSQSQTDATELHEDEQPEADKDDNEVDATNQQLSNEELMRLEVRKRLYHPFCRGGQLHTPTVYYSNSMPTNDSTVDDQNKDTLMPEHSASIGLKHLMNVLSIMDIYCDDHLEDDEWNAIFASRKSTQYKQPIGNDEDEIGDVDMDMDMLQIGMRNRCSITERVISSLDRNITRKWALTERASNLASSKLYFHPADVLDMDTPENQTMHDKMYDTKSSSLLEKLEERIAHALIASLYHRSRGNVKKAAELVIGYIISSTPSLGSEPYEKLPPVLSMSVIEALLSPEDYIPKNDDAGDAKTDKEGLTKAGWFRECIRDMFGAADKTLLRALAYPIHITVKTLKERSMSTNEQIRDLALVDLAAYERIRRLNDGTWLPNSNFEMMGIDTILSENLLLLGNSADDFDENKMQAVSGIACTVTLLAVGEVDPLIQLCETIVDDVKKIQEKDEQHDAKQMNGTQFLLPGCCSAYTSIMCRRWESMKLGNTIGRHTAAAFTVEDKFSPIIQSVMQYIKSDTDWQTIDILIQCCVLLGDGHSLQRLVDRVVPTLLEQAGMPCQRRRLTRTQQIRTSRTLSSIIDAGEIPTVRVINLRRRPDRALDFMACAVHTEKLIVIKGPVKLRQHALISSKKNKNTKLIHTNDNEEANKGDYAFDGQCHIDELEKQLEQRSDGRCTLSDFVNAKWRPIDLKAFDTDARAKSVHTSTTEKACALSHIASWMGVESTLSEICSNTTDRTECKLFADSQVIDIVFEV